MKDVLGEDLFDRGRAANLLIERNNLSSLDDGYLSPPIQPAAGLLNCSVRSLSSVPVGGNKEPVLAHRHPTIVDLLRIDSLGKASSIFRYWGFL